MEKLLLTTITYFIILIFGSNYANSTPQNTGIVVLSPDEIIEDPSRQVVVQYPVTINVAEPVAITTHPPVAPLKTRVVVVHNNMVPVPIECFQPPDSGTCSKDLARIYYDHETRTCKPFSYTGCGGNANRFQSIKNCYRICHPYRYKIRPKLANKRPSNSDSRTRVIKIKTVPAQQVGPPPPPQYQGQYQDQGPIRIGVNTGPSMRAMGGLPQYPPPPPPPYDPYGYPPPPPMQLQYGQPYGYYPPPPPYQQRQMMGHPIVEKQLVRTSDGTRVQEKVIGEFGQSFPHNSGKIYLSSRK